MKQRKGYEMKKAPKTRTKPVRCTVCGRNPELVVMKDRTPDDLNINEWQDMLDRFQSAKPSAKPYAAMRIENTPFTTARHFGGMTFGGDSYTYFEPLDPAMPANPDGTPFVSWLMVRDDFLRWVVKELKKEAAK